MATEYIEFDGKVSWAKVYEPDNAFGASNWKLNFFPKDEDEWKKVKASGLQKKEKENNNPELGPTGKYVEFTRPAFKMIKGKMVYFTGPIVTNEDGKVIVDYINKDTNKRVFSYSLEEKGKVVRRGSPVIIGNGSDVRIRVAFYDTMKGKGQRLEAVQVTSLIEYKSEDRPLPEVLEDVRKPISSVDVSIPQSSTLDDDIPF